MNNDYKNLCQVFTPYEVVKQMLDWCNYKKELYGKKVIENSCGDGHILLQIVKRYIEDCIKNKISVDKIKKGLEDDIYAFETDRKHYVKCIRNLNLEVKKYSIKNINWKNIKLKDALKEEQQEMFDYVIGNPPYIKYKSLEEQDRKYIKSNFITCQKGKFDYCYAFIEKSINTLKPGGKMAYLVPGSIFKNVFAEDLREYIKPHISKIYDYTTENLFIEDTNGNPDLRLTSSCVMIIEKESKKKVITYYDLVKGNKISINKKKLNGKWIFDNTKTTEIKKVRFGDFFKASNTIATLYNEAYVIDEKEKEREDNKYIYLKNGEKLEKDILRPTASPRNLRREINEIIIFPYQYKKDKLIKYSEKEFETKFPNVSNYLEKNYGKKLEKRKSDKNAQWYEYGRSQALESLNKAKLLMSTVITKEVTTYLLSKDTIPYSGIYIQPISDRTLEEAKNILESDEFLQYIERIGIHASGESYRITSKDINNYEFEVE